MASQIKIVPREKFASFAACEMQRHGDGEALSTDETDGTDEFPRHAIRSAPIRKIRGPLPGDPRLFDSPFEHPGGCLVVWNTMKRPQVQKTRKQAPKRLQRKRTNPVAQNEWLLVVKSLGEMMEERVEAEAPKQEKALMDRPAIVALNRAYTATLRYYTHLLAGGRHDEAVQKAISRLWQQAGTLMRKLDASLAQQLKASNSFWSRDVTWQQATIQEAWTHLNSIRVCTNRMDPELRSPFSVS